MTERGSGGHRECRDRRPAQRHGGPSVVIEFRRGPGRDLRHRGCETVRYSRRASASPDYPR